MTAAFVRASVPLMRSIISLRRSKKTILLSMKKTESGIPNCETQNPFAALSAKITSPRHPLA
jgi:hypothetical protein